MLCKNRVHSIFKLRYTVLFVQYDDKKEPCMALERLEAPTPGFTGNGINRLLSWSRKFLVKKRVAIGRSEIFPKNKKGIPT